MSVYLDPTAVVALTVRDEAGRSLARDLNAARPCVVTSVLTEVEAAATLRREHPDVLDQLPATLRTVNRYALDDPVRRLAGSLAGHTGAATGAAVHVATALVVLGWDLAAFVTDDPDTARLAVGRRLPVPAWGTLSPP